MPIYESVAFGFDNSEDIEAAFKGRKAAHTYSRISNPTIDHFERKVKTLSGAFGVLAVSSGMASISMTLASLLQAGDEVLANHHLFGNTYSLLSRTLGQWGLKTRFEDLTGTPDKNGKLPDRDAEKNRIDALISPNTRLIYVETLTNPQLEIPDFSLLSELAREHKIPFVADTTMTPPYLFDAKAAGVDIELLSSTKYMSGGATSVGGLIIDHGTFDWKSHHLLASLGKSFGPHAFLASLRQRVYRDFGACLSPQHAWLQSLGLDTLALRVDRSLTTTRQLSAFLQHHPKIGFVSYPDIPESPWHQRAKTFFPKGSGGVISFGLADKSACFRFMNALRLVRRATNIHDNKTLIIHPASTIFGEYDEAMRKVLGVPDTLLRLSVGIEDAADLQTDISLALEAL